MKKETKSQRIDEMTALFGDYKTFYLFDYTKMTVAQATEFRRALRKQGSSLKVVKNRLALRSLAAAVPAEIRPAFRKPTAVAYTGSDALALARAVKEFATSTKAIVVKGGLVEGAFFGPERFEEVCRLASRPELLAKVGGLMAFPLMKLMRTLQAPLAQMGVLWSQLKDKRTESTSA